MDTDEAASKAKELVRVGVRRALNTILLIAIIFVVSFIFAFVFDTKPGDQSRMIVVGTLISLVAYWVVSSKIWK
jgi:hypothetical protein